MVADEPLVSMGLPVRNGAAYLREAVNSLLAQTHRNIELIVSDNCSDDATPEICREFARNDPRVRYHRQEKTLPAEDNFNYVLHQARGDFFMWAAHDDLWESAFVARMIALLQADPNAVLAFCNFRNFSDGGGADIMYPRLFDLPSPSPARRLWHYLMQREKHGKANPIYGLMRRPAIIAAGGMKCWGDNQWGSDMLVVFRMLAIGDIALSRETLFHKRRTEVALQPASTRKPSPQPGEIRTKIRDKIGYLKGYQRILKKTPGLKTTDLLLLRAGLAQRMIYVCWQETMQGLIFKLSRSR